MFLQPQLTLGALPSLLFLPQTFPEQQLCPGIIAGLPYTGDAAALGSAWFCLQLWLLLSYRWNREAWTIVIWPVSSPTGEEELWPVFQEWLSWGLAEAN